jgi:hypothetical protein
MNGLHAICHIFFLLIFWKKVSTTCSLSMCFKDSCSLSMFFNYSNGDLHVIHRISHFPTIMGPT